MKPPVFPADRQIATTHGQLTDGFWLFLSGLAKWVRGNTQMVQSTQAKLASLAASLTSADTGLRIEVTDFAHVLRWNGTGYEWAPEDDHRAGEITHFDAAPTGNGWKLVNGTGDDGSPIGVSHPIAILKSDGTVRNNTTAAAQAGVFVRSAAAYNGAVTGKTAPTVSTPTITAQPTVSTPVGTIGVQTGAGTIVTVASSLHTHTLSGGTISTPTSSVSAPPVDYSDALPYLRK